MAEHYEVLLIHCMEKPLMHSESGLLEIEPLEEGDETTQVRIHVNNSNFLLEHHPVLCSGFVRAHLESDEHYILKYNRLR